MNTPTQEQLKEIWAEAPNGATHYFPDPDLFYKVYPSGVAKVWEDDGWQPAALLTSELAQMVERPKPQPAAAKPESRPIDDDSPMSRIGDLGNQVHNLGCELQNDENLSDELGKVASTLWDLAGKASSTKPESQEWADGLPPVGTECERHIGQDVYRVTVVGYHEDAVVVYQHDASPDYTDVQPGYLRPLKTDAERERDEFARAILDDLDAIGINLSGDMAMAVAIGFMNRGWRKGGE